MKRLTILITLLFAVALQAEEIAIGAAAPAFSLVNATDGQTVTMQPADGNTKVVVFTCNGCPYAKAFEPRIIELARKFGQQGVRFYALDPNDGEKYPEESLAAMKARAEEKAYPFPYLKDGDSAIARAYGARVTPHVFVVDGEGKVRYRGYVDDSAKAEERQNTALANVLGALTNGREPSVTSTRAFGCGIKWAK